mmetsp:Transcript_40630/g.61919  ORF Transcript_40630/g.61919 Transcript_40630/m.61919 type:complete len:127 (+) Transcript_40630:2186-2566(+)
MSDEVDEADIAVDESSKPTPKRSSSKKGNSTNLLPVEVDHIDMISKQSTQATQNEPVPFLSGVGVSLPGDYKKMRTLNSTTRKKKVRKSKKGIAVYPPDRIQEGLNESNEDETPKKDDLKLVESQQ